MLTLGSMLFKLHAVKRYCRFFGVINGLDFYFRGDSPGRLLKLEFPGLSSPVHLRSGTSDVAVFKNVFLDDAHLGVALDQEPRTIIDLGANIGLVAIHYANLYPTATIIAVEPDPENFALLVKNTIAYGNIRPLRAAVWSSNIPLQIEDPGRDFWGRTVRPRDASRIIGATVPGITVTELMRQFELRSIDLLKIDIEGAEKELFESGCEDWLFSTKAILIELHDRLSPGCSNAFFGAIVDRPFAHSQVDEYVFVRFRKTQEPSSHSALEPIRSSRRPR